MHLAIVRAAACALAVTAAAVCQTEDRYNANQRIQRIRELGRRDAQAIPAIAPNLSDPNPDVRIEAVKAIVKLDTERSIEPLVQAAHDGVPEVQIRATDGLVNYYLPGYVAKGALTGPLTRGVRQVKAFFSSRNDQVIDPDVTVRPDVADALALEMTTSASMDVRANAARAAGILRARADVPALEKALRSKDSQVIFECLVALQKIQDPAAGPAVAFLTHDLDDRVQTTALETEGLLRSRETAVDVRSALEHARTQRVRRAALQALAMLGMPQDRPVFQRYLSDQDETLRAAALEGLGRIREPEDMPALTQAFDEKNADWTVHLAAAFALVSEGKVETSEFSPLGYLVESLDVAGRSKVAQAYLSELVRREDVRRALLPLVPNATRDQKVALCAVLADSHSDDVAPTLTTLTKDIDPSVSMAATRGLRILQARRPTS